MSIVVTALNIRSKTTRINFQFHCVAPSDSPGSQNTKMTFVFSRTVVVYFNNSILRNTVFM